jgi:predicted dehydrogenase
MRRRDFLVSSGLATLALTSRPGLAALVEAPKRVGLIGSGWYGKCDLLRLLQVAPVDVVSLCDVDSRMLAAAADTVAGRQASGKKPRTFADYREMLAERDLDLVLVATPDHWHALPTIAALEAGADVYVQKPVGVDVVECQAILDAAKRNERVVQVGLQRRSTPHLIEARDRIIREGRLGKIAYVEIYCYYHMRNRRNPPDTAPPEHLDYEMWTGPAPMRPYNELVHPRGWRGFMEYCNGIVGDMCVHMLDMVRWMLDLGMPLRISSTGGILVDHESKANTTDTQTASFDFGELKVVWTHRSWGTAPDPDYPWGATLYGDQGTLKASVMSYDFIPREGERVHRDVTYELDEYPEDRTEEALERHVAPAIRGHMLDWLDAVAERGKPVADIEEGCISSNACLLANLALDLGRTLEWDATTGRSWATTRRTRDWPGPTAVPGSTPSPAAEPTPGLRAGGRGGARRRLRTGPRTRGGRRGALRGAEPRPARHARSSSRRAPRRRGVRRAAPHA